MMTEETEFEFDIMVSLPQGAVDEDTVLDALFEAGCDDAVVGLGSFERTGIVGLDFTRSGSDAEAVISETVKQVLAALPKGAQLREVQPDLVSLSDVAARLRVSRQALQKRKMPPPSLGGLYRASEILFALKARPGNMRNALNAARGWFASAPAAQKINAEVSLGRV